MKKLFFTFAVLAILLSGCSKDTVEPATIEFAGGENGLSLQFPNSGDTTKRVTFLSNYDWVAKPSNEWIKILPESGKAGKDCEIVVSLETNNSYDKRSGSIIISAQELNVELLVIQEQKNSLILSTPTVNLPQEGGAFTVQLNANIDYEYEINADWIKSVDSRALSQYALRFEAEANPSLEKRVGEIIIKGAEFSETVIVTQSQTNVLTLSTTEQNFDSEGGTFEVEVLHNVDYEVKIGANWITQIDSRAVESSTLKFSVAKNITYQEREATITILGGDLTETIKVVQKQTNALIILTPAVNLPQEGGTFTVQLNANIDYEYEINADWIKSVDSRALSQYALRFEAEANPSLEKRVGEIIIKGAEFSETVIVTQSQTNVLTLSTTEQNFDSEGGTFEVEVQHNVEYEVNISADWIAHIETRAVTSSTLKFSVAENTTSEKRSATISISGGDITEIITVYQRKLFVPSNQLKYTTTDGRYITPYDTTAFGANIVSNTYLDGEGVLTFDSIITSIGDNAFMGCNTLQSVTIPDGVTSIGNNAFYGCNNLTSVIIPECVILIGDNAFYGCTELKSVTIPNSVSSIGANAFRDCRELEYLTISGGVITIGKESFIGCNSLISVVFGNGDISIGANAFYECTSLTGVTFGSGNTLIGDAAFAYCTGLQTITIPDGNTTIGAQAFYECTSLTSLTFSAGDTLIGTRAFCNCSSLTSVTFGNGNTSIGDCAFSECRKLNRVTNNDSITSIGENAFYNCRNLPGPAIGSRVRKIGDYAFAYCTSINTIKIPDNIISIGKCAFLNCIAVYSVKIPDSVTSIGAKAFAGCTGELKINCNISNEACRNAYFTDVVIGDDVTSIGENAFMNCDKLERVTIGSGVEEIGGSAFAYCDNLKYVTIYDSLVSVGEAAFYKCSNLKRTNVNISDLSKFCQGNVVYLVAGSKYLYVNGQEITELVIPDDVTSIGYSAFYDFDGITSVKIPSGTQFILEDAFLNCNALDSVIIEKGVYSIGESAFASCTNLPSISIPNSVTSIEDRAFYNCERLRSITISDSVISIGDRVFEKCYLNSAYINVSNLAKYCASNILYLVPGSKYLYVNGQEITELVIPDDVTSIGHRAFYDFDGLTSVKIPSGIQSISESVFLGCNLLNSVVIPDSVTSIDAQAFKGCTSLKSVVIPDSVKSIANQAFYNCSDLTSVTMPNCQLSLAENVFGNCSKLENVNIKDISSWCETDFGNIYSNPLYYAKNLILNGNTIEGNLVIPDGTKKIALMAFFDCNGLTSVTVPDSVTSIGEKAFCDCDNLTSVYCKSKTPPIGGSNMFDLNGWERKIYVPTISVDEYKALTCWSDYASYIIGYDF